MGKLLEDASGQGLGGVSRARLIGRAEKSKEAMRGALRYLGHPHAGAYDEATCEVLSEQVWLAADHWLRTHPGKLGANRLDVVLMAILEADNHISAQVRHHVFGGVSLEADLIPVCEAALKRERMQVATEVPIGDNRADLIGFKQGWVQRWAVAVEAKNAVNECERLADQVRAYNPAVDETRVVMTPECMAAITLARGELATPLAFATHVEGLGAKLYLYDATSTSWEMQADGSHDCDRGAFDALWKYLNEQRAGECPARG